MEKLTDDWQHMSNFEILTMQLKEFEKWYDLAVAHHLAKFDRYPWSGQRQIKR